MKVKASERFWTYAILFVGACVMALPFYYMIITALKPAKEVSLPTPSMIVRHPSLQPLHELLDTDLVYGATRNSILIAGLTTLGALFSALWPAMLSPSIDSPVAMLFS